MEGGDEHKREGHDHGNCDHCKNENLGEMQSLWKNIDIDRVSCLNESVHERLAQSREPFHWSHLYSAKKIFRPWGKRLETQPVRLHSSHAFNSNNLVRWIRCWWRINLFYPVCFAESKSFILYLIIYFQVFAALPSWRVFVLLVVQWVLALQNWNCKLLSSLNWCGNLS